MSEIGNIAAQIGLIVLVILLLPCAYRVFKGPSPADRLQAFDTTTTLLIGIVIMVALIQRNAFVIDIGIALAAFAFVGTLAIARFLSDGNVF